MEKQGGILSLPPPAAVTPKSLLVDGAVERGWKVSKGRGLVMGRGRSA